MEPEQSKNKVAIVKHDGTFDSFAKALELCEGLDGLRANDKVLLKPNVVWAGTRNMPAYGIVTTSTMVGYVLKALRDRGCTDITIGEGTVLNKELGSTTAQGYKWSGIGKVAKRYGARLVDFNSEPYEEVQLENVRAKISKRAMECDFLIDLPTLKTHGQAKVSLGMKNLKGCLALISKQAFHRHDLNRLIAVLNTKVRPSLTIIDGIYGLERGPTWWMGSGPHRMNLIIAGKDVFSCDVVGAMVLGIKPDEVEHLREYASLSGRTVSLDGIEVKGEPINQVAQKFEWRLTEGDVLHLPGIEGLTVQYPGLSWCSGCVFIFGGLAAILTKECSGVALDRVEICQGGTVKAKSDSKQVFLLGDCAISANKDLKDAIKLKGCPPSVKDTVMAMIRKSLPPQKARKVLLSRMVKRIGTKLGVYSEAFPILCGVCKPPEFDSKHF